MTTQLYDKRWNPIDTDGLDEKMLLAPLRWKKPRKIFVCSTTDVFGDWVEDEWLDRIFAVMALCPQHTFQILTKRPKRMREYLVATDVTDRICEHITRIIGSVEVPERSLNIYRDIRDDAVDSWPLHNMWLGVTAENQEAADARIPDLLATPAAVRFVSVEPMLGPIDLREIDISGDSCVTPLIAHSAEELSEEWGEPTPGQPRLDWIISGGESGPHARPMHPDWARSLRDQCAAAGPAYFHKQNGEFVGPVSAINVSMPHTQIDGSKFKSWNKALDAMRRGEAVFTRVGKRAAGRLLDGVEHSAFPDTQLKEE